MIDAFPKLRAKLNAYVFVGGTPIAMLPTSQRAPINIVLFSDSVGNAPGMPQASDCFGNYFVRRMKALLDPMDWYNFQFINRSVNGACLSQMRTSGSGTGFLEQLATDGISADVVLCAFGRNDGRTPNWNSGQCRTGWNAAHPLIKSWCDDAGHPSDLIFFTSPHPRSDAGMGLGGISTIYYPNVLIGTATDANVFPPVAQSFVMADPLRKGKLIPISIRHRLCNVETRRFCAHPDNRLPYIDAERGYLEMVYEHGQQAGYYSGDDIHPEPFAITRSFYAGIDAFLETQDTFS